MKKQGAFFVDLGDWRGEIPYGVAVEVYTKHDVCNGHQFLVRIGPDLLAGTVIDDQPPKISAHRTWRGIYLWKHVGNSRYTYLGDITCGSLPSGSVRVKMCGAQPEDKESREEILAEQVRELKNLKALTKARVLMNRRTVLFKIPKLK